MKAWKSLTRYTLGYKYDHQQHSFQTQESVGAESPLKYIPLPYDYYKQKRLSTGRRGSSGKMAAAMLNEQMSSGSGTPCFNLSQARLGSFLPREECIEEEQHQQSLNISAPSQNTAIPYTGRTVAVRESGSQNEISQNISSETTYRMRYPREQFELSGEAILEQHPSISQSEMDMSTSEYIQDERVISHQHQLLQATGRENYVLEDKITEIVNSEDEDESRFKECCISSTHARSRRPSSPSNAEIGVNCIKNNIQEINLMLGFVKIKSFSEKVGSRIRAHVFAHIKEFSNYALYSEQLKKSKMHAESIVKSSAMLASSMERLRKEKEHIIEEARLNGLVRLMRVLSAARSQILKFSVHQLSLFVMNIEAVRMRTRVATKRLAATLTKYSAQRLFRAFWIWCNSTNSYKTHLSTKLLYFARFLEALNKRSRRQLLSLGFKNLKQKRLDQQNKQRALLRLKRLCIEGWKRRSKQKLLLRWRSRSREETINQNLRSQFLHQKRIIKLKKTLERANLTWRNMKQSWLCEWERRSAKTKEISSLQARLRKKQKQAHFAIVRRVKRIASQRIFEGLRAIYEDARTDLQAQEWREKRLIRRYFRIFEKRYQNANQKRLKSLHKLYEILKDLGRWKKQANFKKWRKMKKPPELRIQSCCLIRSYFKAKLAKIARLKFQHWKETHNAYLQKRKQLRQLARLTNKSLRNMRFIHFHKWRNEVVVQEVQAERAILSHNQLLFQFQIGFRFMQKLLRKNAQIRRRKSFEFWKLKTLQFKSGTMMLAKVVGEKEKVLKCQSLNVMRISLQEQLYSERREVMRSECDVLAVQMSQKQQESHHYFALLLAHFQLKITELFATYDFSNQGRLSRVQLALLLREGLNQTAFFRTTDSQLLSALFSSFTLYFGNEHHSLRSPHTPSSPLIRGDAAASLSLTQCISLKSIIQLKLKHFLAQIMKTSTAADHSVKRSAGGRNQARFKTPRSFLEEQDEYPDLNLLSSHPLSPLARSNPESALRVNNETEHTLASRVEKITSKFADYDYLKEERLTLQATVLFLKNELFPSLAAREVYMLLEKYVQKRNKQQKDEMSYSPKFMKMRREELIELVVAYEPASPLTMSDIQSSGRNGVNGEGSLLNTPRIGGGLGVMLPKKQFEKEEQSSSGSSAVFQRVGRTKLNKAKLSGKLRMNKQERGSRGLNILNNAPLRAQDLNESTAHTPKSTTEDNTSSAHMEERVLQMQSDISQIKRETDALRNKLTESQCSPHGKDEVVLPKDLVASLLQQNSQREEKKQKPMKKKKRGASLTQKGIIVAAPLEKVIMTRKGGGGYTVTRRISHSPTYLEAGSRRGRCVEGGLYRVMERRAGGAWKCNHNLASSMDSLNHSHSLAGDACRSRYCLVCRGDYQQGRPAR